MLTSVSYPKTLHRSHWIDRAWVQLPLLLILGVLIPPAIVWGVNLPVTAGNSLSNSIIASAIAAIFTWYSLEKLRYFAKARRLSYVFPINIFTYGAAYAFLAIFRLPHSNIVGLMTFAAVTLISYFIAASTRRGGAQQWLVPGGEIDEVTAELRSYIFLQPSELKKMMAQKDAQFAIVADLHHSHSAEWEALLAEVAIQGIPVYHYRQILEMQTGQVRIDHLRENNFGSLIPNLAYTSLKRVFDVAAGVILLPFIVIIIGIVGLAIKLDSPGPVFFHQRRVGHRGKTFMMHKFRSMEIRPEAENNEQNRHDAVTQVGDERITRLGAFLRRYRIDELPQVFNILRGEMSWIGPRPEAVSLSHVYQAEIPFYRYRHIVRPGITGWAQVNQGHVAAVDQVTTKLRYDFYYVRHISLWLDVLIAMKTLRTLLGGFGAK